MARTRSDVITLANYEALFPSMPDCQVSRHRQSLALLGTLANDYGAAKAEAEARRSTAVKDGAAAARQHNPAGIADACQRGAAASAEIEQLERQEQIASQIAGIVRTESFSLERSDRTYLAWKAECDNLRQTVFEMRSIGDSADTYEQREQQRNRAFAGLVAEVVASRT